MKTLLHIPVIGFTIYSAGALFGHFTGYWTIEAYTAQLIETTEDILTLAGAGFFALAIFGESK